jgi:hypothetical protein
MTACYMSKSDSGPKTVDHALLYRARNSSLITVGVRQVCALSHTTLTQEGQPWRRGCCQLVRISHQLTRPACDPCCRGGWGIGALVLHPACTVCHQPQEGGWGEEVHGGCGIDRLGCWRRGCRVPGWCQGATPRYRMVVSSELKVLSA